jgi:predicted site-specific integrase-resolvase
MSKPRLIPQPAERRAYRVNEFCEAYRMSRATAYKLMKIGKLRYFSVASERRIPVEAAEALAKPE